MDDRRGDWENGVNRNLVSVNSALRQAQKLIDDLDTDYAALDKVLRGDSERDTDGLIARQHAIENLVNELRAEMRTLAATVTGDHAGGEGHEQRIGRLEGRRGRSEKREGYFWHFLTAVAVQVLVLAGALVLNWERIEDFWRAHFRHPPPAAAAIKKPRHGRRKPKPIVLPEVQENESSSEEVP